MAREFRVLFSTIIILAAWSEQTMARPDMDSGRREYRKSCQSCHSLERGEVLEGPSLAGVLGRRAGSLVEFNYSDTMRNSNIIWTEDSLDTYLNSPLTTLGSGMNMMAHGVRDDEIRADLIEFLKHAL